MPITGEVPTDRHCPKCKSPNVKCESWESEDGAFEDYKYTCRDCKKVFWVEGPDA